MKNDFEGIITEIRAGMVLSPEGEADYTWNSACERAISIVQNYSDGRGIFQLSDKGNPEGAETAPSP